MFELSIGLLIGISVLWFLIGAVLCASGDLNPAAHIDDPLSKYLLYTFLTTGPIGFIIVLVFIGIFYSIFKYLLRKKKVK